MKKAMVIVRIIFGVMLLGIGSFNLIGVMPPMQYPEPAHSFMNALLETKYLMFTISMLKVSVGLSLLTRRFIPLALVVFVPVTVNMILFHAFLDFKGIAPALFVGLLHLFLLYGYRDAYKPMLKAERLRANT
ncbi:hypothetical protein [Paenibacillus harenae]|uniref:DoxX family membrane protein n=1 Tax=Paenibacillus harenae TaxID=306543 RepID=A0ABT9U3R5_PAEHA|nr:hypothetical protein [Paenibacillus harenae]MDQ0114198.1 hypothetical protein [Paenibacillus harenae]